MTHPKKTEVLERWIAYSRVIVNHVPPMLLSKQQVYSIALLQAARDHCMSISLLLKVGDGYSTASCLALLRPAWDFCLRGGWLGLTCDPVCFDVFVQKLESKNDPKWPGKKDLIAGLCAALNPAAASSLEAHADRVQQPYSDFTHGGIRQIVRRFGPDNFLGSFMTDADESEIVTSALLYDMIASIAHAKVIGRPDLEESLNLAAEILGVLGVLHE